MEQTPEPLWNHQAQEVADNNARPRLALGWDPRLGKTRAAIEFLKDKDVVRGVVTCPLVVAPQWAEQLELHGFRVIRGYKMRPEQLKYALWGGAQGILVINADKLKGYAGEILKWEPEAYIGDESHMFANPQAIRTKAMRKIAAKCSFVRYLSGTMMPNHAGNLWATMQVVDPENWEPTWTSFKKKHLIMDYMFPSKITGVIDPEEIERRLLLCTSRLTREEVFGPDGTQILVRDVTWTDAGRMLYKQIADEWIATNEREQILDATHALSRLTRLQQISSGYAVWDGVPDPIDTNKVRMAAQEAKELTDAGENVVIFYRFHYEYKMLMEALSDLLPEHYHIDGSVSGDDRHCQVSEFNDSEGQLLIAQLVAGGIGISLASANYALFLTRSFSYVEDKQAMDRIYSPGRAKCVVYYERPKSIDKYIADVLKKKRTMNEALMSGNLTSVLYGE